VFERSSEPTSTSGKSSEDREDSRALAVRSVRAEEIEGEHGDGPSGRLEWVIKRAYDRKYDTTDDYKVDVERTWAFLEDKWTREGATSRLDAVRVVRAYFDNKWTSRGIGELGGIVCVPSVGISRESLQIPKSTSVLSLDSMAATSAGSDGANTTQVRLGREDKDLFPRSDVALANERVQNQLALEKCKYLLENFINQPEAVNFRDPIDPHTVERENYGSVVEEPMGLTIVLNKLRTNAFASSREVWKACSSIWSNCRSCYPSSSRMRKLCDLAELMFTTAWRAQGLNKFSDASDDDSCDAPPGMKSLNDFRNAGPKTATRPPSGAVTSAKVGRSRVASFKCDVCKRSKKGKCGTETAPKSCLLRPENQSRERQTQIRERVSKLKPMSAKGAVMKRKPTESTEQKRTSKASGRRKLTEAEQQENCFRRVFDETDPDNFISQFMRHQNAARANSSADMAWGNSLHLANEQLRLEMLQNQRLARYDDLMTQQSACLPDTSKLASLRKAISHTAANLYEANVKLRQCNVAMVKAPRASQGDYLREQVALEAEIHDLQKKHQELSRGLQLYVSQNRAGVVRRSPSRDASAGFDHPVSVATARVSFDDEPVKASVHADVNDEDILFDFHAI
jgi:hypothetical protein